MCAISYKIHTTKRIAQECMQMASSYEWSLCLPVPCTAIQEVAGMKSDQCIFYTIVQVAITHSFQIEHTMLTRFHVKLRLQNQLQISYCKQQMYKGLGTYNSSTSFIWLRCFGNKVGQWIVSETFRKHRIRFIVRGTLPTSDYC